MASNHEQSNKYISKLIEWTRKILSDIRSAIVAVLITTVLLYVGKSRHWLENVLTQPTPIWLLLCTLLVMFLCYRLFRKRPGASPQVKEIEQNKYELFAVPELNLKFNVTHRSGSIVSIEPMPYCGVHSARLVYSNAASEYGCPERYVMGHSCAVFISGPDLNLALQLGASFIQKQFLASRK